MTPAGPPLCCCCCCWLLPAQQLVAGLLRLLRHPRLPQSLEEAPWLPPLPPLGPCQAAGTLSASPRHVAARCTLQLLPQARAAWLLGPRAPLHAPPPPPQGGCLPAGACAGWGRARGCRLPTGAPRRAAGGGSAPRRARCPSPPLAAAAAAPRPRRRLRQEEVGREGVCWTQSDCGMADGTTSCCTGQRLQPPLAHLAPPPGCGGTAAQRDHPAARRPLRAAAAWPRPLCRSDGSRPAGVGVCRRVG